jgi:hypothetical protein
MKCWHLALETRQRNLNRDDAKPFQLIGTGLFPTLVA